MPVKHILTLFIIVSLVMLNLQSTSLCEKDELFLIENKNKLQEIDDKLEIVEKNDENLTENKRVQISYRLTSFYTNDATNSGVCTGSGLCTDDFQVDSNGWYTYQGKLVLAASTYECLNSRSGACGKWNMQLNNKAYYNYYDEVEITIDDVTYEGIILDSCGACMYIDYEQRMDLFVSNEKYAIDRGYKGFNTVSVFKEAIK